jgi:hypothetical protein
MIALSHPTNSSSRSGALQLTSVSRSLESLGRHVAPISKADVSVMDEMSPPIDRGAL